MYKHVLVAVDGSKESEQAFQKALHLCLKDNAALTITHIIDVHTFAAMNLHTGTAIEHAENYAEELLTKFEKQAVEANVKTVNKIVDFGSPKVLIAREIAPKNSIDLIVCGATGVNAIERLLIGSVSENIVRNAACDVLVVRN